MIRYENKYSRVSRVPDTDDVKQKDRKQIFPELKTKRSFVVRHLCPVHKVLTSF